MKYFRILLAGQLCKGKRDKDGSDKGHLCELSGKNQLSYKNLFKRPYHCIDGQSSLHRSLLRRSRLPLSRPRCPCAHVAPTVTEVKILQVKYVPTVKNVELMNTKKCLKRQVFFHDIDIRLHVVLPLYTAAPSQIETISPGLVWA